jgi:hypothetical protein
LIQATAQIPHDGGYPAASLRRVAAEAVLRRNADADLRPLRDDGREDTFDGVNAQTLGLVKSA